MSEPRPARHDPLTIMLLNPLLLTLPLTLAPVQDARVPAATAAAPHTLPADLVALIPGDASALFYVASIDDLEEAVEELVLTIAPDMALMVDADRLLLEASPDGFDIDLIDRSRPMALALGPIRPMMKEDPLVCLMVPSTNPAELAAAMPFPPEMNATRLSGGYMGISPERAYPEILSVSDLPARLPEGLMSGTIDLEPIISSASPAIEMFGGMAVGQALAEIERDGEMPPAIKPLAAAAVEGAFETILDGLDSLTVLDMAMDLEGARFEAGYSIRFAEGSMLAGLSNVEGAHLSDLVHLLDPDADFTMAMGMDLGGMVRWARPFVDQILDAVEVPEAFPGDDGGPFQSPRHLMDVARETLGHGMDAMTWLGDGFAMSTYLGEKDHAALWMHGVNATNLASSLEALFAAELPGLVGLSLEQSRLGEATTQLALRLDASVLAKNFELSAEEAEEVRAGFAQAFGDAVRLSLTSVGDSTLVFMGGEPADIKAALTQAAYRPGTLDPALAQLGRELGDAHPFGAYRLNLGPVVAEMIDFAVAYGDEDVPPGLAEAVRALSLPLTVKEGMTSERVFQGVAIDLSRADQVVAMILEYEALEAERRAAEAAPKAD